MPLINITIHGDCEESGSVSHFFAPAPVTLSALHRMFPYDGVFHFRLKIRGNLVGFSGEYFIWLDLTDANVVEFSSSLSMSEINIQALVISLPESSTDTDDSRYDNYLESIENEYATYNRPNRHIVTENEIDNFDNNKDKMGIGRRGKDMLKKFSTNVRKGAQGLDLKAAKKGASSIWNKLQQSLSINEPLSDTAEGNLSHLSDDLSESFIETDSLHLSLLTTLWEVLFPSEGPFQRDSLIWKEAGFQKSDPVSDLKASGVLSLRAMTYLGVKYPLKAQSMLKSNKTNTKTNYPFAIVGINITLLLAELLNLREHRYLSVSAGYWGIFQDDLAFFELFCLAFSQMDSIWRHRKAVRTDFGRLIGEIKALVSSVLSRSPRSIGEMRAIAGKEGMATFSSQE